MLGCRAVGVGPGEAPRVCVPLVPVGMGKQAAGRPGEKVQVGQKASLGQVRHGM